MYFEPVEFLENTRDVVMSWGFSNSTGESILKHGREHSEQCRMHNNRSIKELMFWRILVTNRMGRPHKNDWAISHLKNPIWPPLPTSLPPSPSQLQTSYTVAV